MLSAKIEKALNEQLVLEAYASFKYLSMASWCENKGMEGAADFFYRHAAEENDHMMKIFRYINEVGGHAIVPGIKQPPYKFESVLDICRIAFDHEKKVTKAIHNIVNLTIQENDHATHDFLRFFVDEQREEEVLFQRVIDKINLIGEGAQSLYYIDQELQKLSVATNKEQA